MTSTHIDGFNMVENIFEFTYEKIKELGANQRNRMINHSHVNELKAAMENGDLEKMPPVTVNSITNNIIDGQHRCEAFKKAVECKSIPEDSTLQVKFVKINVEDEREAIINANTNTKNWSLDDYVESYSKDNLNYQKLKEFCASHSLCKKVKLTSDNIEKIVKHNYRYAFAIIKGESGQKLLKGGNITITDEELAIANTVHDELLDILKIIEEGGPIIEGLAVSWIKYRKDFPFKVWLKSIKDNKKTIQKNIKNKVNFTEIFKSLGYDLLTKK